MTVTSRSAWQIATTRSMNSAIRVRSTVTLARTVGAAQDSRTPRASGGLRLGLVLGHEDVEAPGTVTSITLTGIVLTTSSCHRTRT